MLYREAHRLLEELADATLDGKRKELMEQLTTVPLLIIDDLGMRKLPLLFEKLDRLRPGFDLSKCLPWGPGFALQL